ncbi:MAG: hypothetical protein ACOC3T_01270 [Bacteroidota bacterium]
MKKITILFILSLLFGAVRAQEKEYKLLVMGSPQHLAINGLRVDLDLPLKRSWQWLVLSPTFYYNKGDDALGFFYESSYNNDNSQLINFNQLNLDNVYNLLFTEDDKTFVIHDLTYFKYYEKHCYLEINTPNCLITEYFNPRNRNELNAYKLRCI